MFYDYFMSFILPNNWEFAVIALLIAGGFFSCLIEYKYMWRVKTIVCLALLIIAVVLMMLPEKEFFYFYYGRPNI